MILLNGVLIDGLIIPHKAGNIRHVSLQPQSQNHAAAALFNFPFHGLS